eukprot:PhM_4_TR4476/c0_g1_i1/m.40741
MSASPYKELFIFLQQSGMTGYCEAFLKAGLGYHNLKSLTVKDLRRMRITNAATQKMILNAVARIPDQTQNAAGDPTATNATTAAPAAAAAAGSADGGGMSTNNSPRVDDDVDSNNKRNVTVEDGGGSYNNINENGNQNETYNDDNNDNNNGEVLRTNITSNSTMHSRTAKLNEYTATTPTAGGCAAYAANYIQHQTISRQWPKPKSAMARGLQLNTAQRAIPVTTSPYDPTNRMYSLKLNGQRVDIPNPVRHCHGNSAKFCHVCLEHTQQGNQGVWQYRSTQEVVFSSDAEPEKVVVWKTFTEAEQCKIELAWKRKDPTLTLRRRPLTFDAMSWGHGADAVPVRRFEGTAVPFPTLSTNQISVPPSLAADNAEGHDRRITSLHGALLLKYEGILSCDIEEEEILERQDICALFWEEFMQIFARERARIEREEANARSFIDGEMEGETDGIKRLMDADRKNQDKNRLLREALELLRQQCTEVELEEFENRDCIERSEEIERSNMIKLISQLNATVHALLNRATTAEGFQARCPICRKKDCNFFCQPWRASWRERGSAFEKEIPYLNAGKRSTKTLQGLLTRSAMAEYDSLKKNRKTDKEEEMKREASPARSHKSIGSLDGINPPPHLTPRLSTPGPTPRDPAAGGAAGLLKARKNYKAPKPKVRKLKKEVALARAAEASAAAGNRSQTQTPTRSTGDGPSVMSTTACVSPLSNAETANTSTMTAVRDGDDGPNDATDIENIELDVSASTAAPDATTTTPLDPDELRALLASTSMPSAAQSAGGVFGAAAGPPPPPQAYKGPPTVGASISNPTRGSYDREVD